MELLLFLFNNSILLFYNIFLQNNFYTTISYIFIIQLLNLNKLKKPKKLNLKIK